jgi:hypothetical protein
MASKAIRLSGVASTVLALVAAAGAAHGLLALHGIRADLRQPRTVPAPGKTLRVPVYVHDFGQDLASYALQVRYDPQILQIQAIDGGTFPGFAERPITDATTFTRGRTRFAAVNRGALRTHRSMNVATIVFRVVGGSGAQTAIWLERASPVAFVVSRGFEVRSLKAEPLALVIR